MKTIKVTLTERQMQAVRHALHMRLEDLGEDEAEEMQALEVAKDRIERAWNRQDER
jgi:hypothetical protein